MDKNLKAQIKGWIKDFELSNQGMSPVDEATFEGSAYYIFRAILADEEYDEQ